MLRLKIKGKKDKLNHNNLFTTYHFLVLKLIHNYLTHPPNLL